MLESKFKEYLVEQFKSIAPTRNAMEYRKKILKQLLNRAQELDIKGIKDENLIYNMCITELGDFKQTLQEFEHQRIESHTKTRKAIVISVLAITVMVIAVFAYIIVGAVCNLWHPTWLIIVGTFMLELIGASFLLIGNKNNKNMVIKRLFLVLDFALLTTLLFLILQVGLNIAGSWQAFIVFPIVIALSDTILVFVTNNKYKWVNVPIAAQILFTLLYVLIGLNVPGFWHPGWLLCLVGVLVGIIELAIFIYRKTEKNQVKEDQKNFNKYKKEDERYYTDWDD